MLNFDKTKTPSPCFVVDEKLIEKNLQILASVKQKTGAKILLAQKAFSCYAVYPLIAQVLDGTTASGLFEAKLGKEKFGKETHCFSPAFLPSEFEEIAKTCDDIVFNSVYQFETFGQIALENNVRCALRINPEHSTQDHAIYDPCAVGSRFGVTKSQMPNILPKGISGLHFHTLCEQNSDALEETILAVEEKFEKFLSSPQITWVNFGGGHHITKNGYDIKRLVNLINNFKKKYDVDVYLEPGEAVVLDAGFLVSTVLDFVHNGVDIAIVDTSAECHMPDVLEMPYRPFILGSGNPNEKEFTYRLGGATCLAGDIIGDYSFDKPLQIGNRLVFTDMALYSMVKTNTFNGTNLPSIAVVRKNGDFEVVKTFGYEDFKSRV